MTYICSKCKSYGLSYDRKYEPSDFLEGKRNSLIWIVGLNPKGPLGENDKREAKELEDYFEGAIHPYFYDFRKVSRKLYELFGGYKGVAHTDMIKCYSNEFPPKNCTGKDAQIIINNCREYLEKQLKEQLPKIILCNGAPVCNIIKDVIKPNTDPVTSYIGSFDGNEIAVILSGFIGRLDNYAKLRLGTEIESHMAKYGIEPNV